MMVAPWYLYSAHRCYRHIVISPMFLIFVCWQAFWVGFCWKSWMFFWLISCQIFEHIWFLYDLPESTGALQSWAQTAGYYGGNSSLHLYSCSRSIWQLCCPGFLLTSALCKLLFPCSHLTRACFGCSLYVHSLGFPARHQSLPEPCSFVGYCLTIRYGFCFWLAMKYLFCLWHAPTADISYGLYMFAVVYSKLWDSHLHFVFLLYLLI